MITKSSVRRALVGLAAALVFGVAAVAVDW